MRDRRRGGTSKRVLASEGDKGERRERKTWARDVENGRVTKARGA